MAVLLILIILILVICGVLVNQRMKQAESFELGPSTELSTCPLESKSYLAKNGDTLCCEGSLSPEGVCAKPLCALAQRRDMPSCKTMLDEANKKAAIACPPSLPNYYTDGRGTTGCTDGALNNDRTAPISPVAKTCKIYPNTPIKIENNLSTFTLNDTNSDSCSIQRRLEITEKNMKTLFESNYIDTTTIANPDKTLLNLTSFHIPNNTFPSSCVPKDELIYLFKHAPLGGMFSTEAGRKAMIDLVNANLVMYDCSVVKALYIDKSTSTDIIDTKFKKFQKTHPDLNK